MPDFAATLPLTIDSAQHSKAAKTTAECCVTSVDIGVQSSPTKDCGGSGLVVPLRVGMNVHISYKGLEKTPDVETTVQHYLKKLERRLQLFRPELVSLH